MLAHELRNPLAPILNVIQIFRHEGDGKQHLKEATGMVERALGRSTDHPCHSLTRPHYVGHRKKFAR